jgi:hypothetical protein
MSPAEASAIEIEEPDWRQVFEDECNCYPRLPRDAQENFVFEAVLRQWRRFHGTPIEGSDKKQPADATAGMIALAELRIFAPRFTIKDVPRDGVTGYQADDHMWLSIKGEQWRITAIEDRMLCLEKRFEDQPETMQIDLNRAKWEKYTEAALAVLEPLRAPWTC